jgi:hypothetical protein
VGGPLNSMSKCGPRFTGPGSRTQRPVYLFWYRLLGTDPRDLATYHRQGGDEGTSALLH